MNILLKLFTIILILNPLSAFAQDKILDGEQENSAVILAYHRVGEDNHPDTSIKIEQFKNHLDEILTEGYKVLAVKDILTAIKENTTLPEKAIGITFEGGFKSAYRNAMTLLLENNLPFTVFYASDKADADYQQFLDWEELKKLEQNPLVDLGILPATYSRIFDKETADIRAEVNQARVSYREHFGKEPKYFAYTFGEYSSKFKEIIKDQGFDAAFGLQSGAIGLGADFMALPRFSMTQSHGSIDRFRLVSQSKPFYISNITPSDAVLRSSRPSIGFSVAERLSDQLDRLSCFVSDLGQVDKEVIGGNRVELRLNKDITSDRVRVNCTLPVVENGQTTDNWRWLGMLMVRGDDADAATTTAPKAEAEEPVTPDEAEAAPVAEDIMPEEPLSAEDEIPQESIIETESQSALEKTPEEAPVIEETQDTTEPAIEDKQIIDAVEEVEIPDPQGAAPSSVILSPEDQVEPLPVVE